MVTDSESGLGLQDKALVSKILLFELYAQLSKNNKTWCTHIMECAIGRASRAMALPDFKLVGPAIHLALPNLF